MNKKTSKPKLSILIPVRNEGINIKVMLKILASVLETSHEILIVYDSSNDDSIPIVKSLRKQYPQVKSIPNVLGKGVTNAIKSGIKASSGEFVLIFAVDDVGPVLAIEDMLALMERGCDLVSCTRYAYGGRRLGGSMVQAFLSRLGNRLFHFIIGATLTDSTTGIKMLRREVFENIDLESQVGWAVVFELAIKAQMLGMRLGEVPIISIDRLYGGKSTFKVRPWLREYMQWFLYGIVRLRSSRKNPTVLIGIPKNTI